jgi:hypothetical protein
MRTLAVVLLMLGQLFAQDQPTPTVKECRANLKQWVLMFQAANEDLACASGGDSPSCPFVPAIRGLDILQLIRVPKHIGACLAVDRHRRYEYWWVLSQTENLIVRRTVFFLISKNEIEDYAEWEAQQRGVVRPTIPEDEPDTVAKE